MPQTSAGLLMVTPARRFLLVHPGGPFFAKKDAGSWSIPKGLIEPHEDHLRAAIREFEEETGWRVTASPRDFVALDSITQKGGKVVHAWAFAADHDPATLRSNEFEIEWPPRSGRKQRFPEVDRAEAFEYETARQKVLPAQAPFLERALERLPR